MFSTHERLKRCTPKDGIDRREFIALLVDEYYETNNLEAQQQVSANLANFAYDPINWGFLKQAKAHELFLEILESSADPALLVHAAAGICNLCLDEQVAEYLTSGGTIRKIRELVGKHYKEPELAVHFLTTLIYLDKEPFDEGFCKLLRNLQRETDQRIANLVTILLEDHNVAPTAKTSQQHQ